MLGGVGSAGVREKYSGLSAAPDDKSCQAPVEMTNFLGWRTLFVTACKAIDGAEFVAGRAVLFLLCDGSEVGDMVGGCHGDGAHPEAREGGMAVEERVVLGVGVEEVEWVRVCSEGFFDVLEEAAEDR